MLAAESSQLSARGIAHKLMISAADIRNFRCFEDAHLKGLKRFTFVVGDSGSGKTSLLEALFLTGGGNPEIYFRVRSWRGFGDAVEIGAGRLPYEAIFRDLFYKFNQDAGAYIRIEDPDRGYRKLQIQYEGAPTMDLPLKPTIGTTQDAFSVIPITFKWETPKRVSHSQVEIVEGRLRMRGAHEAYPITFLSSQTMNARQNALNFSILHRRNEAAPIVEALKAVFPEVEDLSLEVIAGDILLHVSIKGMPERLPLVLLSGGMNKYLSILLAILASPGGVVIVDEIENGLYYRALPKILGAIWALCQETRTQLIASTHSYELLQSLATAMEDEGNAGLERNTAVLRLESQALGKQPTIRLIEGHSYKAAIESNFEIR